jgi:hypothetical protein
MEAPTDLTLTGPASADRPQPIHPLQQRMERYLLRWDRHLDGCDQCLAIGTELCAEGGYLQLEVEKARDALARISLRGLTLDAPSRFALSRPSELGR